MPSCLKTRGMQSSSACRCELLPAPLPLTASLTFGAALASFCTA